MHTPLPFQSLEILGGIHHGLHIGIRLVQRAELTTLTEPRVVAVEELGQRHVLAHHRGRHRLGDLLAQPERVTQHPGGVLHRLLGLDGGVRDDLADPVLAVLVGDVANHLTAPTLIEVDVEVRHRNSVRD